VNKTLGDTQPVPVGFSSSATTSHHKSAESRTPSRLKPYTFRSLVATSPCLPHR
jgi:hypothetical protein